MIFVISLSGKMIHIIGLGDVQLVNRQNREQFVRDDNTDERNTLILCEISLDLLVAKDLFSKIIVYFLLQGWLLFGSGLLVLFPNMRQYTPKAVAVIVPTGYPQNLDNALSQSQVAGL